MAKTKKFELTGNFISKAAKNQGFTFTHAMLECIDNSIDAGATILRLGMTHQTNGKYTWTIQDNGQGMSPELLEDAVTKIGFQGDYNANSISHYGVGMKYGLFAICNQGEVEIKTVHNKVMSVAKFNTFDGPSCDVTFSNPIRVSNPNGTTITVTNATIYDEDEKIYKDIERQITNELIDLNKALSVYYYPKFQANKNFKIFMPNPYDLGMTSIEVVFEDPLYRGCKHLNSGVPSDNDWVRKVTETCKIDGITVEVTGYGFITDKFEEPDLISWDRPRDGRKDSGFNYVRAGVYLQIGPRFATLGESNFLTKRSNLEASNLRIHIKVPSALVHKFLQVNKSKSQIKQSGMDELARAISIIYSWNSRDIRGYNRNIRVNTESNQNLTESINKDLSKLNSINPLMIPQVADVIPEVDDNAIVPETKKPNDFIALVWQKLGKSNVHYDAERAGEQLLIRLNTDHPYVWNHLDKVDDSTKKHEIIKLYADHVALVKAKAFDDFKSSTINKVIRESSDILYNFYETEE